MSEHKKFPESLLWIVTQMRVPGGFFAHSKYSYMEKGILPAEG